MGFMSRSDEDGHARDEKLKMKSVRGSFDNYTRERREEPLWIEKSFGGPVYGS